MEFNKEVGKRIKSARINAGLSLKELGEKVGLSEGTMQRYEAGKIKGVDVNLLKNIAIALDCSDTYLMGWDDTVSEEPSHYYSNPETRKIANKIYQDDNLRILFSAAENAEPEDIQMVVDMLEHFKKTRR